jgi:folate-binding protein YgfZ
MSDAHPFLTALPGRAVIAVTGPEARSFLQRVITNGPEGLPDGAAQFSALLTPQGKVLADFILFDDGEGGLFIDAPASEAESLIKRLTLYRLRADAQIALRDDLSIAAARGEGEAELKTVALAAAPDPRNRDLGLRAVVPAGGPDPDAEAYHNARIRAGVPEFGADYGPAQVFSTDVNHDLIGGVDYKKGCFVGQEVASRMHRKGGVRKRTILIAASAPPEPGAAVEIGDAEIGAVSSAASDHALALVRVDRLAKGLETGGDLRCGGAPASLLTDLSAV